MTRQFSGIFLGAFCLLSVAVTIPVPAKPPRVRCPELPNEGILNLNFETIWEQPAETEDYLLAFMGDAAYDHWGNICIVDFQQKNLVILDPQGNWLRTLGREGEGPGEMQDARKLFFDGDRYGLLQGYPAAIVWLNADGSPGEKVRFGSHDPSAMTFVAVAEAVQSGQDIYGWVNQTHYSESGNETNSWIKKIEPDGSLGPILYFPPDGPDAREGDGINEGRVYDIWLHRWIGDGQGGIWVAPERDQFVLQHWNAQGDLILEVSRDYKPVVRNEEGINHITVWFRRRGWTDPQIHVGKTAPVVNRLRIGEHGNLWVGLAQGGRTSDSDLVGVYDVISPAGEYLQQVRFHSSLDHGSWIMLDDHTALFMATDLEDDEPVITLQGAAETAGSN